MMGLKTSYVSRNMSSCAVTCLPIYQGSEDVWSYDLVPEGPSRQDVCSRGEHTYNQILRSPLNVVSISHAQILSLM